METGPFEDIFPFEKQGCSIAMFVYWRVPSSKGSCHPGTAASRRIPRNQKVHLFVEKGSCMFKDWQVYVALSHNDIVKWCFSLMKGSLIQQSATFHDCIGYPSNGGLVFPYPRDYSYWVHQRCYCKPSRGVSVYLLYVDWYQSYPLTTSLKLISLR